MKFEKPEILPIRREPDLANEKDETLSEFSEAR